MGAKEFIEDDPTLPATLKACFKHHEVSLAWYAEKSYVPAMTPQNGVHLLALVDWAVVVTFPMHEQQGRAHRWCVGQRGEPHVELRVLPRSSAMNAPPSAVVSA